MRSTGLPKTSSSMAIIGQRVPRGEHKRACQCRANAGRLKSLFQPDSPGCREAAAGSIDWWKSENLTVRHEATLAKVHSRPTVPCKDLGGRLQEGKESCRGPQKSDESLVFGGTHAAKSYSIADKHSEAIGNVQVVHATTSSRAVRLRIAVSGIPITAIPFLKHDCRLECMASVDTKSETAIRKIEWKVAAEGDFAAGESRADRIRRNCKRTGDHCENLGPQR